MSPATSQSPPPDSANDLVAEITGLLANIAHKLEPGNDETKAWMLAHSPNPDHLDILQEATLLTLRVLDAIGQREPVNGITIAREFRIPKGSVSRTTRRLIAQKLVVREARPNNRKEFLFRLTPAGRELYAVHRAFDQQMGHGLVAFLKRFDTQELQVVARVLKEALAVSFLDLGAA